MFKVNLTPVPKPRMTRADAWKKRPIVLRYFEFKDALRRLTEGSGIEDMDRFLVVFYIPAPRSYSEKKRFKMIGKPHKKRPDVDNLLKAFMDSLLDEDSHVWDVRAVKVWSDKGRIEFKKIGGENCEEKKGESPKVVR